MPGVILDHNGIPVVYNEMPPEAVTRALRELNPRLFVEKHMLDDGRACWTVQEQMPARDPVFGKGEGASCRTRFYWQDRAGNPLPLAWGIVEHAKMILRETENPEAMVRQLRAEREARTERIRADLRGAATDWLDENEKAFSPVYSPLLPRSQSLRQSRDRERAKGRKV